MFVNTSLTPAVVLLEVFNSNLSNPKQKIEIFEEIVVFVIFFQFSFQFVFCLLGCNFMFV